MELQTGVCLFAVKSRRFGTERVPSFCCARVTLRCYRFKLCCKGEKKAKKSGGCESSDCKGLLQRLNIGFAHIFQEKRAESPTQTSLCATEAKSRHQRPTQGHGGEVSPTQHPLKLQRLREDLLKSLSAYLHMSLSFFPPLVCKRHRGRSGRSVDKCSHFCRRAGFPRLISHIFLHRQDFIYNKGIIYGNLKSLTIL